MEQLEKNIAYNLRKIRKCQSMSLDMLAERTGVSKSMLGQIERGESNPTVTTIGKICEGLKIPIEELIYRAEKPISIVKKETCRTFKSSEGKYMVKLLFPYDKGRDFEIYSAYVEAGAALQEGGRGRNTEEYITVNKGRLCLVYGDEKMILEQGDSVRLNADEEYSLTNADEETLELGIVRSVI